MEFLSRDSLLIAYAISLFYFYYLFDHDYDDYCGYLVTYFKKKIKENNLIVFRLLKIDPSSHIGVFYDFFFRDHKSKECAENFVLCSSQSKSDFLTKHSNVSFILFLS